MTKNRSIEAGRALRKVWNLDPSLHPGIKCYLPYYVDFKPDLGVTDDTENSKCMNVTVTEDG